MALYYFFEGNQYVYIRVRNIVYIPFRYWIVMRFPLQGAIIATVGLHGGSALIPVVALNLDKKSLVGILVGTLQQMQDVLHVFVDKKVILV